MVPFVYSNGELTLILGGKPVLVAKDHPSYALIKKELATATVERMLDLVNRDKVVQNFVASPCAKGRASLRDGAVYLDGVPVHNTVTQRIMEFISAGLPIDSLLKFLERVSMNPSFTAQQELFDFLQNKKLPLTEDGCFLAYKAVGGNWMDKYKGLYRSKPGDIVEVERHEVDDDRDNECSYGLHVGAIEYVYSYGNPASGDHIIVVKVYPKDVVAVPKDCNFQKLRTCRYEVMYEFEGELPKPLYNASADEGYGEDDEEDEEWLNDLDESSDDDEMDDDEMDDDEEVYGHKPNGHRFHNKRDAKGHFTK